MQEADMKRKELITKARKAVEKQRRGFHRKAQPTTDAQGTPEIGGAPGEEPVARPGEGTPEKQLEEGKKVDDGAITDVGGARSPAPAPAPTVQIADNSAVALVKIKESIDTLKSDIEIKKEVIKEMERMLTDAGIPVMAMQRVFDARASLLAGRMSQSEVKRNMVIVAKAQNIVKVMAAETDLADSEAEELAGIRASLETAVEKAQDAMTAIAEGKAGNHRTMVVEALRDIENVSKEYGYWKKLLAFKDAVADSIVAVAEFIETKKIPATANEIVGEFDQLVSMTGKERNYVKAHRIASAGESIRVVAGMTPAASADPIAEIEQLAEKAIGAEMKVDKV